MKLATVRHDGAETAAVVDPASGRAWPLELGMIELIASGATLAVEGPGIALDGVTLLAPIPRPRRNIFCVGKSASKQLQRVSHDVYVDVLGCLWETLVKEKLCSCLEPFEWTT